MVILVVQKKFWNPDEEVDLLEIQEKSEGVLTMRLVTGSIAACGAVDCGGRDLDRFEPRGLQQKSTNLAADLHRSEPGGCTKRRRSNHALRRDPLAH
jgi:hypothetical protein